MDMTLTKRGNPIEELKRIFGNDFETKSRRFEVKAIDDEQRIIEGYASTTDKDDGGDIVHHGAFEKTIQENFRRIKILYNHYPSNLCGKLLEAKGTAKGLLVKIKILTTTLGEDVWKMIKEEALDEFSIGYTVVKYNTEEKDGEWIRHLTELKLMEVSLVTWAMNPSAQVTGYKGATKYANLPLADRDRSWDANKAEKRVRAWAGGDKETIDWRKYAMAFLWHNTKDKENFRAYKLPFADVIDGKLQAIPRGVFASAGVIMGARGGVDIPESDEAKVKAHIKKYYKKLEADVPWEKWGVANIEEFKTFIMENDQEEKEIGVLSGRNSGLMKTAIDALEDAKDTLKAVLEAKEPSHGTLPPLTEPATKDIDPDRIQSLLQLKERLRL